MKFLKPIISTFILILAIGSISSEILVKPVEDKRHLREQGPVNRSQEILLNNNEVKHIERGNPWPVNKPYAIPSINVEETPNDTNKTAGEDIEIMISGPDFEDINMTAEEELKLETTLVMDVKYNSPIYKGRRVDWCLTWAENCGRFAANAYCQTRGYHHAYDWEVSHNIGKTKLIGTGQDCNLSGCDGFKYIKCSAWKIDQEKFYYIKRFEYPEYMGRPLDWCLVYEKWCGHYAANAYCRMKGFNKASGWSKRNNPNHYTHTIGDYRLCNPYSHQCDTFNYIVCTKSN